MDRARRDVDQLAVMLKLILHPHLRDHVHRLVDLGVTWFIAVPKAPVSWIVPPLPTPKCRRPRDGRSKVAMRSATSIGWFIMKGRQATPVADMDAGRAHGDEGEEAFRGRQMRILSQAVMLDRPDAVEAEILGQQALLYHVLEDLCLVGRETSTICAS
jgi:hypothetical protein